MPSDILLIADDDRRPFNFGPYAAELLRMEGLGRSWRLDPRDIAPDAPLNAPGRIVVANTPLGAGQARALRASVEEGCLLVAFLPSAELASAFGFLPTYRTTLGGYLRVLLSGFPGEPMQFHGPLHHLELPPEAEILGECWSAASGQHSPSPLPGVVRLRVGAGTAVFFLYDLPQSVALTRQGDPRRVCLNANEVAPGWRAADMFVDHLVVERAHLPQADLQCHLLRHLLTDPSIQNPPLPWLWYFPDDADTVLLLSSDDDWSTQEQFEALLEGAGRREARITFYLVEETVLTPEQCERLAAEGHTFSIHPNLTRPVEWTWRETVRAHRERFQARFGVPPGCSVRNHAIPWVGWVRGGAWMREMGFRWDSNFFTCPPRTRYYMTGAGLPCPLVDLDGAILDIFEQPAQFSDETTLAAGGFPFSLNLSVEEAITVITEQLRANAEQFHSLLCINTHPVSYATYSAPLWDAVFAEAQARGIPRMALETWAAFWECRHAVQVGEPRRDEGGWEWEVRAPEESEAGTRHAVSLLLPAFHAGEGLASLQWNAAPAASRRRTVHGREYVSIAVPPGVNRLHAGYAA